MRGWLLAGVLGAIRVYQLTLGALLTGVCRFQPSCSRYAAEALRRHGLARGTLMAARRLARCHPLARGGVDPVP